MLSAFLIKVAFAVHVCAAMIGDTGYLAATDECKAGYYYMCVPGEYYAASERRACCGLKGTCTVVGLNDECNENAEHICDEAPEW